MAVVIETEKKKFFTVFIIFIGYSLEDLQKNTTKMCENSVGFECCIFCVFCLLALTVADRLRGGG